MSTWIYLILFPVVFYYGLFSAMMAFNDATMIFIFTLIPLSMPVSIYFIWSRYLREDYKKARLFCFLPIFTFVGAFFIIEILGVIKRL
jgi:hypothetical protein